MLPSPYGDCNDDESYTFMACMERCLVKHTMSVCGCRLVTSNGMNLGDPLLTRRSKACRRKRAADKSAYIL